MNAIWRGLTGRLAPIKAVAKSAQLMALTKKRRLVLATYTSDPTTTLEDSLVKVGYSAKRAQITACELRRDPEFIAAIERKNSQKLEKLERGKLTDQEVVDGIRDIDDECKAAGSVAAYLNIRLKAHELLCKINGMFIERIELGVDEAILAKLIEGRERARLAEVETQEAEAQVRVVPELVAINPERNDGGPTY